jgi:hypothetical protein
MDDDLLNAIEAELERIGAGSAQAGEADSIGVNDESDGWASLGASEIRRDLYWYGTVQEILDRLTRLPTGAGADAVRAEFHVDLPPALRRSR